MGSNRQLRTMSKSLRSYPGNPEEERSLSSETRPSLDMQSRKRVFVTNEAPSLYLSAETSRPFGWMSVAPTRASNWRCTFAALGEFESSISQENPALDVEAGRSCLWSWSDAAEAPACAKELGIKSHTLHEYGKARQDAVVQLEIDAKRSG